MNPPASPQLAPRKAPRQSRSQVTVEAILDATARILVERGFAATSTNAVAERAGVSVGSLYQYFPNKEALVCALRARHAREMTAVIERALARAMDTSLADGLAGLIEAAVEAHRVESDLHRAFETQQGGSAADAMHDGIAELLEERVVALLARHRGELALTDLKLASFMLINAAHGLVHSVTRQRPKGVALKAATREIVAMMHTYLTAPRALAA